MSKKPIHVEAKTKPDMTDEEVHALFNAGAKIAQEKLDPLNPHFGDDVQLQWHAEEDDESIKFFIGVKVSF